MASEIKVNKITGKGATGGADAPLQFDGNTLTAAISKINLSGTTPASPVTGDMHFNPTIKMLLIYTGTTWQVVSGPTGGDLGSYVSSGTTYYYHTFLNSARFTCPATITCDFLIIAGGGGGGGNMLYDQGSGGGGAGGMRDLSSISVPAGTHEITVGMGGQGALTEIKKGENGENSSIALSGASTYSATAGGGGGSRLDGNGNAGGSGGGSQISSSPGAGNAGSYSPVEGYIGGAFGGQHSGGGGGGAGGAGLTTAGNPVGGLGGPGRASSITGVSVTYAGGGAGGTGQTNTTLSAGGSGGGGRGGAHHIPALDGKQHTGSGGGGSGGAANTTDSKAGHGGDGGSGIVVIRYAI